MSTPEQHEDNVLCTLCTKLEHQAQYCMKCSVRSFCRDTCENANVHVCFTTETTRKRRIVIDALAKILEKSDKFRDLYVNTNKPKRVRRRGDKHVFVINIDDDTRIRDVASEPAMYCGEAPVSELNKLCGEADNLLSDWSGVMGVILHQTNDMYLIRLIPVFANPD